MASHLQKVLRDLCCNTGWCYAVYWKLKKQTHIVLKWENGYPDPHKALDGSTALGCQGNQEIALQSRSSCDARMLQALTRMSYHVYTLGEGIIGRVASTDKHQWVFNSMGEVRINGRIQSEYPMGWLDQFGAGIKTISVIPVPQGVVQLGSTQMIAEDFEFVTHVKALFSKLQCFQSSDLHSIPLGPDQAQLNASFFHILKSSKLNGPVINNLNAAEGLESSMPFPSNQQNILSLSPSPLPASLPSQLNPSILPYQAQSSSILGLLNSKGLPQSPESCNIKSDKCIQSSLLGLSPNIADDKLPPRCTMSSSPTDTLLSAFCAQAAPYSHMANHLMENSSTLSPSLVGFESLAPHQMNFLQQLFSPSGSFGSQPSALPNQSSSPANELVSSCGPLFGVTGNVSGSSLCWSNAPRQLSTPVLSVDSSQPVSSASSIGMCMSQTNPLPFVEKSCSTGSTCNIFDGNGVDNNIDNSGTILSVDDVGMGLQSSSDCLWQSYVDTIDLPLESVVTNSGSCLGDVPLDNNLQNAFRQELDEFDNFLASLMNSDVTNPGGHQNRPAECGQKVTTRSVLASFWDPVNVNGSSELVNGASAIPSKPLNSESCASHLKPDEYLHRYKMPKIEYVENNMVQSTSAPKAQEEPYKGRKRLRPGEKARPRPRDRQQIQDRVHELRDIIPSSKKCSIDALLEKTIKYINFLQTVTSKWKQSSKLQDDKDFGASGTMKGGTSWAMELGEEGRGCPIIVENLSQPGQMLVEMLCEDKGIFLEIADSIRGLGLTIMKGVMELRNDKIWARFVVEADREVHRIQVLWSLMQLLESSTKNLSDVTNPLSA